MGPSQQALQVGMQLDDLGQHDLAVRLIGGEVDRVEAVGNVRFSGSGPGIAPKGPDGKPSGAPPGSIGAPCSAPPG
jgi:hypothetical protein